MYGLSRKTGSEKFKLLLDVRQLGVFSSKKKFHRRKLLVRYAQHPHLAIIRQQTLDPTDMHIGILHRRTLTQINRELEHREPVAQQILTELGSDLAFLLCLGRQIKEHKNPHDTIFTKPRHLTSQDRPTGATLRKNIWQGMPSSGSPPASKDSAGRR